MLCVKAGHYCCSLLLTKRLRAVVVVKGGHFQLAFFCPHIQTLLFLQWGRKIVLNPFTAVNWGLNVAGTVKKKHPYFQIAFFRHTKEMQKIFQTGCKKEGRKESELIPTNSNKQILLFFSFA